MVRIIMRLFWHYKLVNKANLQGVSSVLIASNHISWFDPPFIGAVIPFEIGFLAKAELFKHKWFGSLIAHLNAIPIVRHKADMAAITASKALLDTGKSLLMFPEGTRKGKKIKPGVGMFAMKMQRDILPVYIENADKPLQCMFFLKRLKIVIGEKIQRNIWEGWSQDKDSYQKLAEYVYSQIMELGNA